MKKTFKFFCLALLLSVPTQKTFATNTCIDCHQKNTPTEHADWKKSVHAAKGVGCEMCHGGNPNTTDPVKAHQGVLSSKDEKSSIHFQKVPETCGQCHHQEFAEFQKSVHYKTLQRTGKGPNCLTCHGAMATTVLTYADLEQTCSLCHGQPTQAAKAFSMLHTLKNSLAVYRKKSNGNDPKEKEFTERYQALQKQWHSFNVTGIAEQAQSLIKEIKNAEEKLKKS